MDHPDGPFSADDLDTYAAVYERDVDLALVAAIRSSAAIRAWLREAAGFPLVDLLLVRHSWSTAMDRESDIEVRFGASTASYVLQIENKLDSGFQPDQQAAYAARAACFAEVRDVVAARCVLFCPDAYARVADSSAFDAVLTYEQARDVLLDEGAWGREVALLIQHAIVKHRRGGFRSPDDPVRTEFFRLFADAARTAGLPHVPPRGRKRNAGFFWWPRKETLRQLRSWLPGNPSHGAWLAAKLVHGWADIELTGIGAVCGVTELEKRLEIVIEAAEVKLEVSGAALRIRRRVPVLDPDLPFEEQQSAVHEVVQALQQQISWWHEVGHSLVEAQLEADRP